MANENETVADICAKLKDVANGQNVSNDGLVLEISQEEIWDALDRIEAAHQREVAELRELLKTILPYAEAGYCTRKTTHGCTGCPLSSIISGCQYVEPICRVFKWRKMLEGVENA